MKRFPIFLLMGFALLSFSSGAISGNELKLVVELYRHGNSSLYNYNRCQNGL